MRTARKAGLKPKDASQKRKYVMPTPPMSRRSFSLQAETFHDRPASICCEEELSSESNTNNFYIMKNYINIF